MSVRPELGPTLPEMLAARGVSRRAMLLGFAGLVVLVIVVVFGSKALSDTKQLTVAGPPQFNVEYDSSVLAEEYHEPGELMLLQGRRKHLDIAIAARAFKVPAYEKGDLVGGYLPSLAEQRIAQLRKQYGVVQIYDEGKARFGEHTGYQIGFSAKTPEGRLFGRDAYVLPGETGAKAGILLSLRRVLHGRQTPADEEFFKTAKLAYGSFNFGADRP